MAFDVVTYTLAKNHSTVLSKEYTDTQTSSYEATVKDLMASGYSAANYVTAPEYAALVVDNDWAPAFNQCIKDHSEIYVPKRLAEDGKTVLNYTISSSIFIPSDKYIYFEKGAKIIITADVNAIVFTGSRIKLENLNIELKLDEEKTDPNKYGKIYMPYTSNVLLFPATMDGKNPVYNEFITIIDPTITGQEVFAKEPASQYNQYRHYCHTDPYKTYLEQKETYNHGVAINFLKEGYHTTTGKALATTGMAVKIVRPRINGFSCGVVMSGDRTRKGWCTEVEIIDAIYRNMSHAIDVLPGWIERCKFSGYVQCHTYSGTQTHWSVFGGDFCTYNVGFWDSNKTWIYVPNYKRCRPIINGAIADRILCDDFGETRWLNHPRTNFTPNTVTYCTGLTGDTLTDSRITKLSDNSFNVHFSYPVNQKVNEVLFLKDGYKNYMMNCPTGDFAIEFKVNNPPRKFDIKPAFTIRTNNYLAYESFWPYIPEAKITEVISLNLTPKVPELTLSLDKTDHLKIGDELVIWDVIGFSEYRYRTSISECWVSSSSTITAIDGNTITIAQKRLSEWTFEQLQSELTNHQVSKKYFPTVDKTVVTVMSNKENLVRFQFHIEDFNKILKPDNLCIGVNFISISANTETPLECDVNISDIKIIT